MASQTEVEEGISLERCSSILGNNSESEGEGVVVVVVLVLVVGVVVVARRFGGKREKKRPRFARDGKVTLIF